VRYLSGPATIPKNPETFQNWLGVINGFNPSQKYACHFSQSSHAWLKNNIDLKPPDTSQKNMKDAYHMVPYYYHYSR
jgi:hypothetical protein